MGFWCTVEVIISLPMLEGRPISHNRAVALPRRIGRGASYVPCCTTRRSDISRRKNSRAMIAPCRALTTPAPRSSRCAEALPPGPLLPRVAAPARPPRRRHARASTHLWGCRRPLPSSPPPQETRAERARKEKYMQEVAAIRSVQSPFRNASRRAAHRCALLTLCQHALRVS